MAQLQRAAISSQTRCVLYNPKLPPTYRERLSQLVPEMAFAVWTPDDPEAPVDASVLLTTGYFDPRPVLERAPGIRWIHSLSTGVDQLIVPEVTASDIILTNSGGCMSIPIAEHVMACILAFARQFPALMRQQAAREWHKVPSTEINGATVAIIGYGSIGQEVAKRARALGMCVLAVRRSPGGGPDPYADQVYGWADTNMVLQSADYVVNALPLTADTHHFFHLSRLEKMKQSAVFINIGRGDTVDEAALICALQRGAIAGAALDVFNTEPLSPDSQLWEMGNVLITPHNSFSSHRTQERVLGLAAQNLRRFEAGLPLINLVDKHRGY